ncbi:Beta-lactamase [Collimonas arenae]|uniref:Beta-lactamase n=1 Tax=Collimonas arenae TaxID=279058 RepID=A0A0A1FE92_9BURK|nr:class C beta-lactamase [Collimonas arenae]AIY41979.1 Beta-lactamase [Collimonas arenae]
MHRKTINRIKLLSLTACFVTYHSYAASNIDKASVQNIVDAAIQPLLQKNAIPGMAIAVTVDGKNYIYNYGVASKETRQKITDETLFEVGSFSKTFAATIASYAEIDGKLSLSDSASKYLPSLRGGNFDAISLLNFGTHTSSLPLFVPDSIENTDQLLDYLKKWQPSHAAGTYRNYSNIGIGMLGMIAAKSMNESYDDVLEKKLFPELGMTHSYLNVPADQTNNYAQGYTKKDEPVRLNVGMLASEAYGVKSTAADLIRFIDVNINAGKQGGKWQRAVAATHIGYFNSGAMTQDLMWEQYPYPVELKRVLAGNAATYTDAVATKLNPSLQPQADVLINKTGSTNGFATYAAFVPAKKIGVVILANKNYAIDERVTAAYQILTQLDDRTASKSKSPAK